MRLTLLYTTAAMVAFGLHIEEVTSQGRRAFYEKYAKLREVPILSYNNEINPDGSYRWNYETGHGIVAQEEGKLKNRGNTKLEAMNVEGSFSYLDDNGVVISMTYTADENGFHPKGTHLPTPPPTPDYILRALAYIRSHRSTTEDVPLARSIPAAAEAREETMVDTTELSEATEETSMTTLENKDEPKCYLEDVQYKVGEAIPGGIPSCTAASCKLKDGEPAVTCDILEEQPTTTDVIEETTPTESS